MRQRSFISASCRDLGLRHSRHGYREPLVDRPPQGTVRPGGCERLEWERESVTFRMLREDGFFMTTAASITTATHPERDTVLYDGQCRFCRGQMAILRRLDPSRRLQLTSLHDPSVGREYPELPPDLLLDEMVVIDRQGRARAGAQAWRHLARRLPLLWPLAIPLHIPGSLPLWNGLYRLIARNRYRFAGKCDEGTCRLP